MINSRLNKSYKSDETETLNKYLRWKEELRLVVQDLPIQIRPSTHEETVLAISQMQNNKADGLNSTSK